MRAKTQLDEVGSNITVLRKPNPEELREIAGLYGVVWDQSLGEKELGARYNDTPNGIRLAIKRIVGLYRRSSVGGLPPDNVVSGGAGAKPEEEVGK